MPNARGRPAGEEAECVGGGRAGLGGEGDERLSGVAGQLEALPGQGQLADDAVPEPLGAAGVPADVVAGPEAAEAVAAGRAGRAARRTGGRSGCVRLRRAGRRPCRRRPGPVGVQLDGPLVEEGEPGAVRRAVAAGRARCLSKASAYSALASGLAARRSSRPFCTKAGTPGIASSSCWTPGRTRCCAGRRRLPDAVRAPGPGRTGGRSRPGRAAAPARRPRARRRRRRWRCRARAWSGTRR